MDALLDSSEFQIGPALTGDNKARWAESIKPLLTEFAQGFVPPILAASFAETIDARVQNLLERILAVAHEVSQSALIDDSKPFVAETDPVVVTDQAPQAPASGIQRIISLDRSQLLDQIAYFQRRPEWLAAFKTLGIVSRNQLTQLLTDLSYYKYFRTAADMITQRITEERKAGETITPDRQLDHNINELIADGLKKRAIEKTAATATEGSISSSLDQAPITAAEQLQDANAGHTSVPKAEKKRSGRASQRLDEIDYFKRRPEWLAAFKILGIVTRQELVEVLVEKGFYRFNDTATANISFRIADERRAGKSITSDKQLDINIKKYIADRLNELQTLEQEIANAPILPPSPEAPPVLVDTQVAPAEVFTDSDTTARIQETVIVPLDQTPPAVIQQSNNPNAEERSLPTVVETPGGEDHQPLDEIAYFNRRPEWLAGLKTFGIVTRGQLNNALITRGLYEDFDLGRNIDALIAEHLDNNPHPETEFADPITQPEIPLVADAQAAPLHTVLPAASDLVQTERTAPAQIARSVEPIPVIASTPAAPQKQAFTMLAAQEGEPVQAAFSLAKKSTQASPLNNLKGVDLLAEATRRNEEARRAIFGDSAAETTHPKAQEPKTGSPSFFKPPTPFSALMVEFSAAAWGRSNGEKQPPHFGTRTITPDDFRTALEHNKGLGVQSEQAMNYYVGLYSGKINPFDGKGHFTQAAWIMIALLRIPTERLEMTFPELAGRIIYTDALRGIDLDNLIYSPTQERYCRQLRKSGLFMIEDIEALTDTLTEDDRRKFVSVLKDKKPETLTNPANRWVVELLDQAIRAAQPRVPAPQAAAKEAGRPKA